MHIEWSAPPRSLLTCLLILASAAASGCAPSSTAAQGSAPLPTASRDTLHVYGPGGPLPAMREAAAAFGRTRGITVKVTGGPTPEWLQRARADADLIYSGSEAMMTDFVRQMEGRVDESTVHPLYLRPSAILVRPGNPRGIRGFTDLLRPGIRVLVVQGAGQTGLWEDMAGRRRDPDRTGASTQHRRLRGKQWRGSPALDAGYPARRLDHLEHLAGRQPNARRRGRGGGAVPNLPGCRRSPDEARG